VEDGWRIKLNLHLLEALYTKAFPKKRWRWRIF
jgi:hypothetical protein